ncbi:MAG: fumarylacetoacetate hydrolase family protein [Rhodobiaceae bacterium]|nr:fumarylacetoacetate hydrolase family protein [Rhodobiaceae bacterium]
MRLITFTQDGSTRIGRLNGDEITDLSQSNPELPTDLVAFLEAGDAAMDAARAADGKHYSLSDVKLESPVLRPSKMLAVALNYRDHLEEVQEARPEFPTPTVPILFTKQNTSINGPYDPIYLPKESEQLDYEAELAIVIGKRARRVPKERAMEVVAGSTINNDVTIRDWQLASPTMTIGKSWDSHCPLGPSLVTLDEVDPTNLEFTCTVNGEVRQQSNTSNLIFDIPTLIEHVSTALTLMPGDVILTGTTSGVALWMPGQPWLKEGDKVRVEMDQLGAIENEVVADPVGTIIG